MYQELREVWTELTAPGAPFEVTEIEVRGVRLRAYAGAPPSLREFWLASAAHGDADYLVYEAERWTYSEAHREVAAAASWVPARRACRARGACAARGRPRARHGMAGRRRSRPRRGSGSGRSACGSGRSPACPTSRKGW